MKALYIQLNELLNSNKKINDEISFLLSFGFTTKYHKINKSNRGFYSREFSRKKASYKIILEIKIFKIFFGLIYVINREVKINFSFNVKFKNKKV